MIRRFRLPTAMVCSPVGLEAHYGALEMGNDDYPNLNPGQTKQQLKTRRDFQPASCPHAQLLFV